MKTQILHHIYYSWTGWPELNQTFAVPDPKVFAALAQAWVKDGFTLLSHLAQPDQIQVTSRVDPDISPYFYATRIKGRLQHALRTHHLPCSFRSKLSVRSLGHAPIQVVDRYVADQARQADLADERFRGELEAESLLRPEIDTLAPRETDRGMYWYGLHLVLVTEGRFRLGAQKSLPALRDALVMVLGKLDCPAHRIALMPDHVHVLVKASPALNPAEIACAAHAGSNGVLGGRIWQDSVYVATVGAYSVNVLPRALPHKEGV
jgi:REP element-mobilizing transposase RayT